MFKGSKNGGAWHIDRVDACICMNSEFGQKEQQCIDDQSTICKCVKNVHTLNIDIFI